METKNLTAIEIAKKIIQGDRLKLSDDLNFLLESKRQLPTTKVASLRGETSNCLDTANLLIAETISRGLLITKAIIVRKLSNGLHSSE